MRHFPSNLRQAVRTSRVLRWVRRRLPTRIKRAMRSALRLERSVTAKIISRWHRSLQLRVIGTTLAISMAVIAILGFFLTESIADGLLSNAENLASTQARGALEYAESQDGVNSVPAN